MRREAMFTLEQVKTFSEMLGHDARNALKALIAYSKYEGDTKSVHAYEKMMEDL